MTDSIEFQHVSRENVLAALKVALAKYANLDGVDLNETTELRDIGISSFDALECIFELEEKFKVDLNFNANDPNFKMNTAGGVVDVFMRRLEAKAEE